jgi:hypothetical protein
MSDTVIGTKDTGMKTADRVLPTEVYIRRYICMSVGGKGKEFRTQETK